MKIKFTVIGIPEMSQPRETSFPVGVTAQSFMEVFTKSWEKQGRAKLSEHYSLLINGRNVLSMPEKMLTKLKDGDELIFTVQIMGG